MNNEKGLFIPAEYMRDDNLNSMEEKFLSRILWLDNGEGCTASNNYFARYFGITREYASMIIKGLIKKKYITAEYERDGREIVKRVVNIVNRGVKNSLIGCQEEFKEKKEYKKGIADKKPASPKDKKKQKITTPLHNEIKQWFYDNYPQVHAGFYSHGKKEAGQIDAIIKKVFKNDIEQARELIFQKANTLRNFITQPRDPWWGKQALTPGTLLSQWNKLTHRKADEFNPLGRT